MEKILKVNRFFYLMLLYVLLYCVRTKTSADMKVVPKEPASAEDHAGVKKIPDFWIRTGSEPDNCFSRFGLLRLSQGLKRHLQDTNRLGLA